MDLMYVSLTLFLLFILSFSFLHHHHKSKKNLPPGSAGWPILGESLDFLSAGWKGHPEKFILDRVSKYSSSIFRTHLLGSQAVVFCGPASNKFLFSNEYKLVQSWWPSSVEKIFPYSAQTSSKEAIRFRKMLPNFLKPEALHRYIGIMDAVAHHHFASDWENKDFVIVFPLTKRYTFRLACRLFLSLEEVNQVTEFTESFNNLAGGIMSVPINFPGTPFHRAIKASSSIRKKLLQIIKERKRDLEEGKTDVKKDILSHMLLTIEPESGKFMGEADIVDKILGLLIGGHDTTSSACTSIVKYLAELPEVYRRVYDEQTEIEKSKAPGELLSWEDIQKMKYSWNVACEVMRLAPPVPGAFREALTDFMYNGFFIPKGWKIYWSTSLTHKDSELFPEPEKFDPSRFEEYGPAPYTYVPFGGGPRTCPGKEYARIEMLVFMHHLVKRFKWEKLIPNEKIVVDPMPIPEKGLPIRLFPHHKA